MRGAEKSEKEVDEVNLVSAFEQLADVEV